MKAISIKEPWASMILRGEKTIETRTWKTKYRGWLLLHASQRPKSKISGKIFAMVYLHNCIPMTKEDEIDACCEVYDRAWSWIFTEMKIFEPFEYKGQLSLYEIPDDDIPLSIRLKVWENIEIITLRHSRMGTVGKI